ncbi:MAG: hypothetical protein ABIN18_13755 [Pseudomonadota bacterium]
MARTDPAVSLLHLRRSLSHSELDPTYGIRDIHLPLLNALLPGK